MRPGLVGSASQPGQTLAARNAVSNSTSLKRVQDATALAAKGNSAIIEWSGCRWSVVNGVYLFLTKGNVNEPANILDCDVRGDITD